MSWEFFLLSEEKCHSNIWMPICAVKTVLTAANPPFSLEVIRFSGDVVVMRLVHEEQPGGIATLTCLQEEKNSNHDLRGKEDADATADKRWRYRQGGQAAKSLESRGESPSTVSFTLWRIDLKGCSTLPPPSSPLNYEGNQPELNSDFTGITARHIRHPSVKITTSLALCGGPCHAMITRQNA